MTVTSSQAVHNARKLEWPIVEVIGGVYQAEAPGGYKFYLEDKVSPEQGRGLAGMGILWCVCE